MSSSEARRAPLDLDDDLSGELDMTEPYTLSHQDRALFEEICFLYNHALEVIQSGQDQRWESVQRRRLELLDQLKARRFDLDPPDPELRSWADAVRHAEQAFISALKAHLDLIRGKLAGEAQDPPGAPHDEAHDELLSALPAEAMP